MTNEEILSGGALGRKELITLLNSKNENKLRLFKKAAAIKKQHVRDTVFFRGLIEFSNICRKNCFYCGIRSGNTHVNRYDLSDDEILHAASFAHENNFGSVVLQSGENNSTEFIHRIENLLKAIGKLSGQKLRVTLSLGEQEKETYRRWFESGAHRYLLRIESSSPSLYKKLHPDNENHRFEKRCRCLVDLKETGYQTGTGVMIGLPFQTIGDLADDLLFMKDFDVDMVGMGPYIEHGHTPLYRFRNLLMSREERFELTLKMIAVLRILMKDINIASATALQAIDRSGREKALMVGANVIMPNITPGHYRNDYKLYQDKPCTDDQAEDFISCLKARIALSGNSVAYGEWGDSVHYLSRS